MNSSSKPERHTEIRDDTEFAKNASVDDSLQPVPRDSKNKIRLVFIMMGIILAAGFIIGKYIDY